MLGVVKWNVIILSVCMLIVSIVPDYRDLKMMVALTGVETAVKSEKVQHIAEKSVKVVEQTLDDMMKSEKEDKNGK